MERRSSRKQRKSRPRPVSWLNVHQMSEPDVRALCQYIQSLRPKGEEMPPRVPPEQEPETPYMSMVPQNMGEAGGGQDSTEVGSSGVYTRSCTTRVPKRGYLLRVPVRLSFIEKAHR